MPVKFGRGLKKSFIHIYFLFFYMLVGFLDIILRSAIPPKKVLDFLPHCLPSKYVLGVSTAVVCVLRFLLKAPLCTVQPELAA